MEIQPIDAPRAAICAYGDRVPGVRRDGNPVHPCWPAHIDLPALQAQRAAD